MNVGPIRSLRFRRRPPITELSLYSQHTLITHLADLGTLPLREISLGRTQVRDVSPLAHMPTLEAIELPEGADGVESLRALPNLKRLSCRWDKTNRRVAQTAEEFRAEFDARRKP